MQIPWIEKHRPSNLQEVVGNSELVMRLRAISQNGNMPHLLLTGPPGVGKTTCIAALAMELLDNDRSLFNQAVLELNASDERGIDVVRNRIKAFATKRVVFPQHLQHRTKIIILDEADSMTAGAQQALRRIMEVHANTTRFALACNTSSKIIEPIQSRCAILRFNRISDSDIVLRLIKIATAEGVQYSDDGIQALCFTADGDLRSAVNNLQSAAIGTVTAESVYAICDTPNPSAIRDIISTVLAGDYPSSVGKLNQLVAKGYAPVDLISTFFRVIKTMDLPDHIQLALIRHVGIAHANAVQGLSSNLQLSNMLASMIPSSSSSSSS